VFTDEAKKLLLLDPAERTKDMIRYIMISLNFSVPEFSEFPINIQRLYASHSYYQEFEPDRVIVRQGHFPIHYYMIISGVGLVIEASANNIQSEELIYTPKRVLTRGDCFGDRAIINNSKRTASVRVHGNKPLCMLSVDKEGFYLIQGNRNNKDKLDFLLTSVPLLNSIEYPFHLLEKDNRDNRACFSMYYRNGAVICADSQMDDWLYVIKTGSCKLIKRIKFDEHAFNWFLKMQNSEKKQNSEKTLKTLQNLLKMDDKSVYFMEDQVNQEMEEKRIENEEKFEFKNHENKYVYLELSKLKEGDVFGLNDLVFNHEDDCKCSLMLVSEGIECILINRHFFLKHVTPQLLFKLKYCVPNYPDDDYFIRKYFSSFIWRDFKTYSLNEALSVIAKSKSLV
jgi:CRP-like cAMP-binding protein